MVENTVQEQNATSAAFAHYHTLNHPTALVESASMAGIDYPVIKYRNRLPQEVIDEELLSDAQIKTINLAGEKHSTYLSDGTRAGFLIGDSTGVGKGRELAGIIYDNYIQGRKKALFITISQDLKEDIERDLKGIKADIRIERLNDYNIENDIDLTSGIIFTTYSTLISKSKKNLKVSRLAQVIKWLGKNPVIIFDECHRLKNLIADGGFPTQSGLAGLELQEAIPDAYVVYSSATNATDVRNMAYMVRTGLWGAGTPFPEGFVQFMNEVEAGGIGAMEVVSRDMKALGMLVSRSLSYEGVIYSEVVHTLEPHQIKMYNLAAEIWRHILEKIKVVLEAIEADGTIKKFVHGAFWSSHQRFFSQLITAFKVPTLIKYIEEQLNLDKSIVISLINTMESRTQEKVNRLLAEKIDLEELDFTPREVIKTMLERAFPINQYEKHGDGTAEVKRDSAGEPLVNSYAMNMRQALMDKVADLQLPDNPLDQIINHFGVSKVSEVTGRKKRLIKNSEGKTEYKKRAPEGTPMNKVNVLEMEMFQNGRKRIAIISDAAACGISLHADKNCRNQQKRVQITLQVGWSADKQMQTFGRTHRTNQLFPPEYVLLVTDIGGERRFASTIARRLGTLGALTKGQGDTLSGNSLGQYNFETDEGKEALAKLYRDIEKHEIRELKGATKNPIQILVEMGIIKQTDKGDEIKKDDYTDVPRFLNRILAVNLDDQNAIFDKFCEIFNDIVEHAKEAGTFQTGVTDLKAEEIRLKQVLILATDKQTKAKTNYYLLETDQKVNPLTFAEVKRMYDKVPSSRTKFFAINMHSKNPSLIYEIEGKTNARGGTHERRFMKQSLRSREVIDTYSAYNKFEKIESTTIAKQKWDSAVKALPTIEIKNYHIIGGAILHLWHKLKNDEGAKLRIVRTETIDKKRIVGIEVPPKQVQAIIQNFNEKEEVITPAQIYSKVYLDDERFDLPGNTSLFLRRVEIMGENRIELAGIKSSAMFNKFCKIGLFDEEIQWETRFFIPLENAPEIIQSLLDIYQIRNEVELESTEEISEIVQEEEKITAIIEDDEIETVEVGQQTELNF